jgi:hypothetical protein
MPTGVDVTEVEQVKKCQTEAMLKSSGNSDSPEKPAGTQEYSFA